MKQDYTTFWDYMNKANATKDVLEGIPIASSLPIEMDRLKNPKHIQAIVVNGQIIATTSKRYKLVQHREAFEPIFTGLHNVGSDYEFVLNMTDTKAFLNIFVDEIKDDGTNIKLGFQAINSLDGRGSIYYNIFSDKIKETIQTTVKSVQDRIVDVWGYRQVCSNGMKIRVPLKSHIENRIVIEKKTLTKIDRLLSFVTNVIHLGNVEEKTTAVQYVVEAMALLKEPVARIIDQAKQKEVGKKKARELISKYIGKRLNEDIYDRYQEEKPTLWGLYNAITYVASHGVSIPTSNGLINRSATMLQQEVFPGDH